jgi:twitching motility two-component system response regulator PilH
MAKRALICDDLASDRLILAQILRGMGLEVIEAKSGQEGIEMSKANTPDIIFMDIVMPDINGFQVVRQITKSPETSNIPVIMVSTKDRAPDIMNSKANGAKGHICKPIKADMIKDELKKINFSY